MVAEQVRFLHVMRSRKPRIDERFNEVLCSGKVSVPEQRGTLNTGKAEGAMSIGASVYFFAGRAFPDDTAKAVFVVDRSELQRQRAPDELETTPFDSGSTHYGFCKLPCEPATAPAYVREHTTSFSNFVPYFAGFLSKYFDTPEDYWKQPPKAIDGVEFSDSDDFRNWSFEVRCRHYANVSSSKLVVDEEHFGVFHRASLKPGAIRISATVVRSAEVVRNAENLARQI